MKAKPTIKKALSALCALVLAAVAVSAPALRARLARGHEKFDAQAYRGILTLYTVDTFEGGVGSRADFLLARAGEFEKKNKGVLISVETHTPESLAARLAEGKVPDMISFGPGAGDVVLFALELSESGQGGGAYSGKTYAVPWCRGAYCLISKGEIPDAPKKVIASKGAYNQPLLALLESGLTADAVEEKQPVAAYTDFLSSGDAVLLGTQRDIHRLERRGVEVQVRPLPAFSDLFQYFAVTAQSELTAAYSRRFLEHLLSGETQEKLDRIGMLPAGSTRVYREEGHMRALEDGTRAPAKTLSAFTSAAELSGISGLARAALAGDAAAKEKIRALLVSVR